MAERIVTYHSVNAKPGLEWVAYMACVGAILIAIGVTA